MRSSLSLPLPESLAAGVFLAGLPPPLASALFDLERSRPWRFSVSSVSFGRPPFFLAAALGGPRPPRSGEARLRTVEAESESSSSLAGGAFPFPLFKALPDSSEESSSLSLSLAGVTAFLPLVTGAAFFAATCFLPAAGAGETIMAELLLSKSLVASKSFFAALSGLPGGRPTGMLAFAFTRYCISRSPTAGVDTLPLCVCWCTL